MKKTAMSFNLQKHYPNIEIKPDLLQDLNKKRKKVIKELFIYMVGFIFALSFLFVKEDFNGEKISIFSYVLLIITGVICLYNCIGIIWNSRLIFSKKKINQLQDIVNCLNENQIERIQFVTNNGIDYLVQCIKHSSTINHLILEFDIKERYGEKYVVNENNDSCLSLNLLNLTFSGLCKFLDNQIKDLYTDKNQNSLIQLHLFTKIDKSDLNLLFDLSLVHDYAKI